MGYHSWIMAFIQEHEGEPIAKVIEALLDKEAESWTDKFDYPRQGLIEALGEERTIKQHPYGEQII